ncbi:MAG TPA: PKD domain-containing protein [Candidatus Angelobacter sp.]|nr:PKD domain-containing protein [Candidatus Angelobacter sp.]
MRFVARVVTILFLGSFLLTPAFAEDNAKASTTSSPDAPSAGPLASPGESPVLTAPETDANSTGYLAPADSLFPPQAKAKSSSSSDETHPAVDIFAGYSFVRFSTHVGTVHEHFDWHGLGTSVAGNVNRWFSVVADFGFYTVKNVPSGVKASGYTYLFGPRFSHRGEHWTPFVHALFGAARLSNTITPPPISAFFNRSFHQNAFATALGGGMDLDFNKHVGWRIIQVEYLLTRFTDGGDNQQNNVRAATGFVFHLGGNPPPPPPNHPPTVTVSANPSQVFAGSGDSIALKAQGSDPDNDTLTYKWTATGGAIDGTGTDVRWNSSGVKEGTYTVTVTADDGRGGTANASTDVKVAQKPNSPPVISSCSASPATITVGQKSTITTTASDPDNDPLTYSYKTTGGTVTGTEATAQFDSAHTQPGTYTVTCHVSDGRGGETDATTQVTVQPAPEQRQLEQRLSLHSIYFPTAQPTVANPNGGLLPSQERTLTNLAGDFKKYLEFRPDAHLILQGHADPRGTAEFNKALSDRRVARTKAFLVEQGVAENVIDTQGLGVEQPMSADQVKQAVDQEQNITAAQKAQLKRNAAVLALAQSRRVDVTLSTTGQTSVRQFPFNAEDALNLLNPHSAAATHKAVTGKKTPTGKTPAKKAPPKKQ